jgi:hypothetical protein
MDALGGWLCAIGTTMKRFLIPSLLAAGFIANNAAAFPAPVGFAPDDGAKKTLFEKLRLNHIFTLARHSSHSSHASHASHASHRSSTGGYSSPAPAPIYNPPAPVVPATPSQGLLILPGNSAKFTTIVRQVQLGLTSLGYYDGAIDGVIGPKAKAALKQFQTDYSIKVTGTVTPEVLDQLGIAAN